MQFTFLVVIAFFLLCLLIPTHSNLIRAPLTKLPRQKKNTTRNTRKLTSFSGSMSVQDYMDMQYGATINVGSKDQELTFVLDTGSSTMWIPANPDVGSTGNYFECASSSTCNSTDIEIELQYGKGTLWGDQIQDQIQLGDLTVPQFPMVSAVEILDMQGNQFDGLIGLGFTTDPESGFPTVLQILKQYNLISVGMFSLYLGYDPSSSGGTTGEIIFGGYDPQYATSDFQFINITNTSDIIYWQTNVSIGYGTTQNLTSESRAAIFDSGTSALAFPDSLFESFLHAANAQGGNCIHNFYVGAYVCDCSAQDTLDSLYFYFQGSMFTLSASQYISNSNGECVLGISAIDENLIILGDTFLSNYYALFTADNCTVGLATARPVPTTTSFPVWAIILIVLGSICIIALVVYLCYKRKKRIAQSGPTNAYGGKGVTIGTTYIDNGQY